MIGTRAAIFYAKKDVTKNLRVFLLILLALAFGTANVISLLGVHDSWNLFLALHK